MSLETTSKTIVNKPMNYQIQEAPSSIDFLMMKIALKEAMKGREIGEVPVGAVIYRGKEILAKSHNRKEIDNDPSGHAEIIALRKAAKKLSNWRLTGCSIAVTLEPCPMCAGALVNARIDKLIYGCNDPKSGACNTLFKITTDPRLNHRITVISGIYKNDSKTLLQNFFKSKR